MEDLKVLELYTDDKNKDRINKFTAAVKSEYTLTSNYEKVEANFEWLDIMENTVMYIDNILRNPNRFIINEEEVVKVELARRTTVESLKHLSIFLESLIRFTLDKNNELLIYIKILVVIDKRL